MSARDDLALSVRVEAWRCAMCQNVHATKENADDCCTCSGCGVKFRDNSAYRTQCEVCSYGANLRNARATFDRAVKDLKHSHERLRILIEKPPPGKKRPKLGLPPLPDFPEAATEES